MKNIFIVLLTLIAFNCTAQAKLIKFQSGMEKCLDPLGVPIEDCFVTSNTQGKFTKRTIEYVLEKLNVANEGNIDSIYSSDNGDTLIVDYIVGPTLRYYAPGVNGILSSGNNGKKIGGTLNTYSNALPSTIWSLTNGQANPNQFVVNFSTSARQLLITTGSAQVQPLQVTGYVGTTSSSRVWRAGSASGNFNIVDATTGGLPTRLQILPGSGLPSIPSLVLQADGDVQMGQYDAARASSSDPTNFSGWDASGVMQKYDLQSVIDTVEMAMGLSGIIKLDTIITSAELLTLTSNPFIAVPGQPGKIIDVHRIIAYYDYGTIAYTGQAMITVNSVTNSSLFSNVLTQGTMQGTTDRVQVSSASAFAVINPEIGEGLRVSTGAPGYANGDGTVRLIIVYEYVQIL
jgi:hypothetical protein